MDEFAEPPIHRAWSYERPLLGVDLTVPVYLKALQIPQRRDILHLTESEVQLGQALQIPRRALCRQQSCSSNWNKSFRIPSFREQQTLRRRNGRLPSRLVKRVTGSVFQCAVVKDYASSHNRQDAMDPWKPSC